MSSFFNWQDPSRSVEGDFKTSFVDLITGKRLAVPDGDVEAGWKALTDLLRDKQFETISMLATFLYEAVVEGQHGLNIGALPSTHWQGVTLKDRAVLLSAMAFALDTAAGAPDELRVRSLVDEFPLETRALVSEIGEKLGGKWLEIDENRFKLASIASSTRLQWSGENWEENLEILGEGADYGKHPLNDAPQIGFVYAGTLKSVDERLEGMQVHLALRSGRAALEMPEKLRSLTGLIPEQTLFRFGDQVLMLVPARIAESLADQMERLWNTTVGSSGFAAISNVYSLMQIHYGLNQNKGSFDDVIGHLRRLHEERVWGCPAGNRRPLAVRQIDNFPFLSRCFSCHEQPTELGEHGLCSSCSGVRGAARGKGRSVGVLCVATGFSNGLQWSGGVCEWMHFMRRRAAAIDDAMIEAGKKARGKVVPIWCGQRAFMVLDGDQVFEAAFKIADQVERTFARQPAAGLATGLERYSGGYEFSGAATPSLVCGVGVAVSNQSRSDIGVLSVASALATAALRNTLGIGRSAIDYCLTSASCIGNPATYKKNFLERRFQTDEGAQAILGLTGRPYSLIEMQGLLRCAVRLRHSDIPTAKLQHLISAITAGKTRGTLEYLYMRARAGKQKDVFRSIDEWWHGSAGSADPYRVGRVDGMVRYETYLPDIFELSGFLKLREEKGAQHATV